MTPTPAAFLVASGSSIAGQQQTSLLLQHEGLAEENAEEMLSLDIDWKEYNYHNGKTDDEDDEPSSSASPSFVLFPSLKDDEEEEDDEFSFKYPGLPEITLRGESDNGATKVFRVTGMAIWSATVLCQFLVAHPHLVEGRNVLELGAGTGLNGIVAHHLGASKVVLTDGDLHALHNLRHNATKNTSPVVSCPQLIWGEGMEKFHDRFGSFQVILASDCIYMNKCIEPFWKTVDRLLLAEESSSSSSEALLIYVNTCVSQATFHDVAESGRQFGFEESSYDANTITVPEVHFFRRRQQIQG